MTTATFSPSASRAYRHRDRLARKSVFKTLFERFVVGRQVEAELLLARIDGRRWCDATERSMIDNLTRHPRGF